MCARRLAILAFMGAITWASVGLADEKSDYEKARIAYVKKDYVEANARFEAMLDPKSGTVTSPLLLIEAHMAWGATKVALGKKDEARALFEKVLRADSSYSPDELTYAKDVLQAFADVKAALRDDINQDNERRAREARERLERAAAERARLEARVKELEGIASLETVMVVNSRWAAAIPFGVGQFQNGATGLGTLFLATEGAATLATFVLFAPYRWNIDQFNAVMNDPAPLSRNHRITLANDYAAVAQNIRTADFILLGALGAAIIAGVIQAELAYKPVVTFTRTRKVPGASSFVLKPTLGGIYGSF